MIDTRRTHQMTKMAMFERKESLHVRAVSDYSKREYVSFWTVLYVATAVIVYLLYIIAGILIMIAVFQEGVPGIAWIIFVVLGMVGFIFHTYFYVRNGRRKAAKRYDENSKKNEYMTNQYRELDGLYSADETTR